jgi:hypothetical protein
VIVGPGFGEEFFPDGKPEEDSPILPSYYANRTLREISEAEFNLDIAGFAVYDYFGDGSFYLINSPGVRFFSFFNHRAKRLILAAYNRPYLRPSTNE